MFNSRNVNQLTVAAYRGKEEMKGTNASNILSQRRIQGTWMPRALPLNGATYDA